MKRVMVNGEFETMADDVFERCGMKKCTHEKHKGMDGCIQVTIEDVDHPYYVKGTRYPNGHLVYFACPNRY